jgi:hypothetical protein
VRNQEKFSERILQEKWPTNWFEQSTKGGEPWIFYMSETFVDHCLVTINGTIDGAGRYSKEHNMKQLRRAKE